MQMPSRSTAVLLALLAGLQLPAAQAQQACNGYSELCDKTYDQVVSIGAHNSYAVSNDMSNLAANQAFNVTTQLRNGIRLLQGQGHMNGGELDLCHTACGLLDGGSLTDYLSDVKAWLDDNPNEVVTLLWVNSDSEPVSTWAQAYNDSGVAEYVYTPSDYPVAYGSWPTLSQLISDNTRVVSFIASEADYSSVPYLLDEFTMVWETPYDTTDSSFPCTVDRPKNEPDNKMYLINHFLAKNISLGTVPDLDALNTTNSEDSIMSDVKGCNSEHSQNPTFIMVDYYEAGGGSVFEVAASLNGVDYNSQPIGNDSLVDGGKGSSTAVDSTELSAGVGQAVSLSCIGAAALAAGLFMV